MHVELKYCSMWNYEPQAVSSTGKLLKEFKQRIKDLKLIPGGGGCFELSVDGDLIYSKLQTGTFPDEIRHDQGAGQAAVNIMGRAWNKPFNVQRVRCICSCPRCRQARRRYVRVASRFSNRRALCASGAAAAPAIPGGLSRNVSDELDFDATDSMLRLDRAGPLRGLWKAPAAMALLALSVFSYAGQLYINHERLQLISLERELVRFDGLVLGPPVFFPRPVDPRQAELDGARTNWNDSRSTPPGCKMRRIGR